MKIIGIIGGMGPAATIDLYKKIVENTKAEKDQEHIHVIIDSYPQIEDRTEYILYGGKNPAPRLIESAKRLESAGADALIMPCNTAHYFAKDIENIVNIPLIHIVKCSAEAVKNNYPKTKKIGLIATKGTIKAKIYNNILKDYGFETLTLEEYSRLFQQCIDEIADLGADLLIAGCTEIPLLMPYVKTKLPVIDATYELACAAVKFALEK